MEYERCVGFFSSNTWLQCVLPMQVTEEDYNFDGKPDQIRFKATAQSLQQVYSAKLLLQFSYQLQVGTAVARMTVLLPSAMPLWFVVQLPALNCTAPTMQQAQLQQAWKHCMAMWPDFFSYGACLLAAAVFCYAECCKAAHVWPGLHRLQLCSAWSCTGDRRPGGVWGVAGPSFAAGFHALCTVPCLSTHGASMCSAATFAATAVAPAGTSC